MRPAISPNAPNAGRQHTLWHLVAGPTIWSLYFLACYTAAAVRCAKADSPAASLGSLKAVLIALTVAALAGIAVSGVHAWRHWSGGPDGGPPHGGDTPESRQQFVAFATLLLSGLSFVATLYVALPAFVFDTCR